MSIMSGSEIISTSPPVGSIGDGKETEFIKVQNEDELRLAQMGMCRIRRLGDMVLTANRA